MCPATHPTGTKHAWPPSCQGQLHNGNQGTNFCRCLRDCVLAQVKQFYTAPTAIRSLMRSGDEWVSQHSSRASLRLLGTVGEPINPEAWRWYHDVSAPSPIRWELAARQLARGLSEPALQYVHAAPSHSERCCGHGITRLVWQRWGVARLVMRGRQE